MRARNPELESAFPNLQLMPYEVTSEPDANYNCIAWAVGVDDRFWWPVDGYWPKGVPQNTSVETFAAAFRTVGFEVCADGALEEAVEKLVIYAFGGETKHAARQLEDGTWTSKCGRNVDISHTIEGVSGVCYGHPTAFMSRARASKQQGNTG